jgi:hypothetical protein
MTNDEWYVACHSQPFAKSAYVAAGVTSGKTGASDPVPGYVMDHVRKLAHIDQCLQRDFSPRRSGVTGNKILRNHHQAGLPKFSLGTGVGSG